MTDDPPSDACEHKTMNKNSIQRLRFQQQRVSPKDQRLDQNPVDDKRSLSHIQQTSFVVLELGRHPLSHRLRYDRRDRKMIEVILDDRLGKKVRVKCNADDTIGMHIISKES